MAGSLYSEINVEKRMGLFYPIWFLLRRLSFITVAIVFADYPGAIHLLYLVLQQLIHVIYILSVYPFEEPLMNKMEAFNEICILGIVYHFFIFFDFVEDEDI